ncbi:MAG: hypothetical protein HZB92_03880 [Euryarchaeota archaeon]|jgi:hypothetical protein|nr:hypothetical protein [Euryarchaeota archaeon]
MKASQRKALKDDNPFVDVAAYLFLEDIADKQGASGMNNYLVSLATSLANSMPAEEYDTWDQFVDSLQKGESIITTFETIIMATSNCVVTTECPFEKGWQEYTKRIGSFSKIHYEVAEYYNATVKPGASDSQCIIHQTFRKAAAERIKVGGKVLRYAQVAAVSPGSNKTVAPDEWLPILLAKSGISHTMLNMILRNNACVWILYTE